MPARFCICAGCPACGDGCRAMYDRDTAPGYRCPPCQASTDARHAAQRSRASARRPSRQARGYDTAYDRNRAIIVRRAIAAALAGQPRPCWLCHEPCLASQKLSAEHKIPLRSGGTSALANLAAAHLACNTGWNRRRA